MSLQLPPPPPPPLLLQPPPWLFTPQVIEGEEWYRLFPESKRLSPLRPLRTQSAAAATQLSLPPKMAAGEPGNRKALNQGVFTQRRGRPHRAARREREFEHPVGAEDLRCGAVARTQLPAKPRAPGACVFESLSPAPFPTLSPPPLAPPCSPPRWLAG